MKKSLIIVGVIAAAITLCCSLIAFAHNSSSTESEIRKTAEKFIRVVDDNDNMALEKMLHPQLVQYVYLNGKLIPFKAQDFVQMVNKKEIGGTPRNITFKSSEIVRGYTASVIVQAVSREYDFMYQLSMAKSAGEWIIVGILVDIVPAE